MRSLCDFEIFSVVDDSLLFLVKVRVHFMSTHYLWHLIGDYFMQLDCDRLFYHCDIEIYLH